MAVVVDLAGEVGVGSVRRLQDNLDKRISKSRLSGHVNGRSTHLGAIGELMGGQVDLAKGAFANETAEGIVADRLEVLARKFTAENQPRSATSRSATSGEAQDNSL